MPFDSHKNVEETPIGITNLTQYRCRDCGRTWDSEDIIVMRCNPPALQNVPLPRGYLRSTESIEDELADLTLAVKQLTSVVEVLFSNSTGFSKHEQRVAARANLDAVKALTSRLTE